MQLVSLFLSSCQKEQLNADKPSDIVDLLHCAGFSTQNMKNYDDYVVVEGDIIINKKELLSYTSENTSTESSKTEQWVINNNQVVSAGLPYFSIKYYIQPSMDIIPYGSSWKSAIHTAVDQWSFLPDCNIYFIETFTPSEAQLTFYGTKTYGDFNGSGSLVEIPNAINASIPNFPELPSCTHFMCASFTAKADFPLNNQVGKYVVIPACDDAITLTQRTHIIAHEIGHTLGFRHSTFGCPTNDELSTLVDCAAVNGANQIWGSPACDESSLMFSGEPYANTFNENDKRAARMVYPKASLENKPAITSVGISSCGTHCRTWTVNINNPLPWYNLKLILIKNSNNQVVKIGNLFLGNSPNLSLQYNVAGNYRLQVLGISYNQQTTVGSVNTFNVNIP